MALFTLLLITGLATPLPLPQEEGILVNFGSGDTGEGVIEPAASASSQSGGPEQQLPDNLATPPVTKKEETATTGEEILTQDFEEAAVIKKATKVADPDAELKKKQAIEEQKRIDQLREEERIKKETEEKERVARETAEREAAAQEAKKQEIIDRTRNALKNAAAAGTGTNTNQGIAGGKGNQGRETGSLDSSIYGDGTGTGTRGIGFNLAGRTPTDLPPPIYDIQKEGIVVVEVTVDRNGKVIQAEPGVKGSTTLESYFLEAARKAAMATKFNAKPDAELFQKGTITYHFILK